MNNARNMQKHLEEMNGELLAQLRRKDEEIERVQKEARHLYSKKLRDENGRDEVAEFKLTNPYDKPASKKRNTRLTMSPLERNNSTYTHFTNLVYSEEQSAFSGTQNPNLEQLGQYLSATRNGLSSPHANSLEGTFVSKHVDFASGRGRQNSTSQEYRPGTFHADGRAFSKQKEGATRVQHNMTFGEQNHLQHKPSDKKVH